MGGLGFLFLCLSCCLKMNILVFLVSFLQVLDCEKAGINSLALYTK